MFDASAEAEELTSFHTVCQPFFSKAKPPCVGRYSVPHVNRACYVARQGIDGKKLGMSEEAWDRHLRGMHTDRTAGIFDLLSVHRHSESTWMF